VGPATQTHHALEDVAAMLTGTGLVALGATLFAAAGLYSGGTAGVALLVHHATGLGFGPLFLLINLPFFALALARMGWKTTLRTALAVALVAALADLTAGAIAIERLDALYAACLGGALIGVGMLILFRHRASLGGVNLLALYLQDRHGLRAGYVQLAIDLLVLLAGVVTLDGAAAGPSLVGAVVLNVILATNHKPGRYVGVS
jgi:uncharacterized membrane-anchored protein YitT (DUF2179 family)